MTPVGPGSLLAGRFQLDDLLAEKDGARFWRATDKVLMRDVAVHVVDEKDERAAGLLEAARRSATVTNPHLLRVLDASTEEGVAYVVNEWGTGMSLDRMVAREALPPQQAAWIVREVADALADAHRHGVTHGRLIPENVMVTESGSVKLIGFCVDCVLHGRAATSLGEEESDVRDLGALLYAALVARWPGSPGSQLAAAPTDHGHLLSPRQVRAGVPAALDRLCMRILEPGDRSPITTAEKVRQKLVDYLDHATDSAPVEATQRIALPAAGLSADPEATQAAIPALSDQPTQVQPALVTTTPTAAPAPTPEWDGDTPGSSWLRLAGLVGGLALLVIAVVVAFNLGRGNLGGALPGSGDDEGDSSAHALPLVAVRDFDPFQDGEPKEENPDLVPLAHDGDPATSWSTLVYKDGPDITVYKPGVGLLLDLGKEVEVADVKVTFGASPTDVHLLAAPEGAAEPTGIDGLQEVAAASDAGTEVTLTPSDAVTTRYLVVWLTALPPTSGGYQGRVAEIVVRS